MDGRQEGTQTEEKKTTEGRKMEETEPIERDEVFEGK